MFAKFRSTRTPAATSAPRFEAGSPSQSASKTSPSLVKRFFRVKHVFRRSSSAQKDADHQGSPTRQQGIRTLSQPSQGRSALTQDDRAEFHRRPYLHPSVEPTRSSQLLNPSPPFQAGWQGSTSAAPRPNLSAAASPLLAPPQSVAAGPATPSAPTRLSSNCSAKSGAPRLTTSINASSQLAPPAPAYTTVRNDAGAIERQDAPRQGTPSRRQGVPPPSRPSQVPSALRDLSPPFQVRWQGSNSAAHHSNPSATASPLLLPPRSVAAAPATSFAATPSSSSCLPQSAAPRSTTSLNASSLAPPTVATTPATRSAPARSSSPRSATHRSTFSPKISSPLAPPQSVAPTPATTFSSARRPSQRPAVFTAPTSTSSFHASPLLAPPQSVATTPATEYSSAFSSFNCSKPSDKSSSAHQLIAELEETVADLHRQYNDARRCVHTMTQWHVFPYAKSLSDEAKKAKEELDEVLKQIAAVDMDCSQLEALLHGEHKKLEEVEEALKHAYWHREGVNEEHALLQDDVHELQAGQPVNGVWQQRASEPLQLDLTPSQSAANQERGSSLTTLESSQRVKSWDSQWESMIERQRYSLPRPAQVTTSESNEPERRTNNMRARDARPADTSDFFGTPLRWGQLAPVSSVHPQKENTRPGKHA